jgi:hypothetical protein
LKFLHIDNPFDLIDGVINVQDGTKSVADEESGMAKSIVRVAPRCWSVLELLVDGLQRIKKELFDPKTCRTLT